MVSAQRKMLMLMLIVTIFNVALMIITQTPIWGADSRFLFPFALATCAIALYTSLTHVWRSVPLFRVIGMLLFVAGQQYVVHSFIILGESFSFINLIHCFGFFGMYLSVCLNFLNQLNPLDVRTAPKVEGYYPYVAAVIPTYGEPLDIVMKTMLSLKTLNYPKDKMVVIISDDGHRDELRELAERHNVLYNPGARKDAKAGNLNSAVKFIDEVFPQAELILTQDADEIIHPNFLKHITPYFHDPKIAVVQTPKEVYAPKGDPFGTRDRVFYDRIQVGRNGTGAAFACGSGVIWRIEAIKDIGGFATWNIVEDLTTTYFLHSAGWKSAYHNQVLSIGLAPDDIPGLLKQRGTWAADSIRLFLFDNPMKKKGLTPSQRLQYFETGVSYLNVVFFTPMLMLVPIMSTLTDIYVPINSGALATWMVINTLYFLLLANGNWNQFLRVRQYWDGHTLTYIKAFIIALKSKNSKPKYQVTRKTRVNGFYGSLLWLQFAYLFIGAWAFVHNLVIRQDLQELVRLSNLLILSYYMVLFSGIVVASFHGSRITPPWARKERTSESTPPSQPTLAAAVPIVAQRAEAPSAGD
jgi:cellulose synthase/poly-beta-1,6-N-acetylglucosamine synthase-like glycosyltransferase